jgi:hypothetical protein
MWHYSTTHIPWYHQSPPAHKQHYKLRSPQDGQIPSSAKTHRKSPPSTGISRSLQICPVPTILSCSLNNILLVLDGSTILPRLDVLSRLIAELEILLQRNGVLDAEEDDRRGDEKGAGNKTPL